MSELTQKRCQPCEGGVPVLESSIVQTHLAGLTGWKLTHDGKRIRKDWKMKDFVAGIHFLDRVADLAEEEGHHPDLHLEEYRKIWIEIWTHAVGGLSENDFILAAKIDTLPLEAK